MLPKAAPCFVTARCPLAAKTHRHCYLPRGRHRPLPCVFVYARCKQPCIVIIAHCAALGLWLRSPSLETRRSSPMHKIKDGDKMPLICSQLAKCVVNPAKVWMSMSRTKGRAFQPHELTIKKRKKGICLCCAPCTLTPKGRRCWRCCSGWITMSTFSELIQKVQSFTFVIIYLHFTNFMQGPVWKIEQHLVAICFCKQMTPVITYYANDRSHEPLAIK